MSAEPVALIGRNGMGKSTMCAAIVGLLDRKDGSVRLDGVELMGKPAYRIARPAWASCRRAGACSRR